MFDKVKLYVQDFMHQRYLKKMGWTQEAYERHTDPDHNIRASRVNDFYHGYPYLVVMTESKGLQHQFGDWLEGVTTISDWCREHCIDKVRYDILRAYSQTPIGVNSVCDPEWWINDIGGQDILCWAFKGEQDFIWFKLKWGHLG